VSPARGHASTTASAERRTGQRGQAVRTVQRALLYLGLLAGAVLTITPFAVMVSTSLTGQSYVLQLPPRLIPAHPTAGNYAGVLSLDDFPRYFLNSVLVSVAHVVLVLLLGSMMAYAFAHFEFPGKRLVFGLIVGALMIPGVVLIIPQFLVARDLHLLNSRLGLVLFYVAGQLAFITFLLRGFFASIPRELAEAMEVDGAGAWRVYWNLMLPLARPALGTAAIFAFLFSWDEFAWALTIIDDPAKRTLPIAIALFQGQHTTAWGVVFAASVIAVLPVLVIFVIFQRYLVSGLQAGALKG
jgi:ABC-type glycerol-3-phosphate transport system permease component